MEEVRDLSEELACLLALLTNLQTELNGSERTRKVKYCRERLTKPTSDRNVSPMGSDTDYEDYNQVQPPLHKIINALQDRHSKHRTVLGLVELEPLDPRFIVLLLNRRYRLAK